MKKESSQQERHDTNHNPLGVGGLTSYHSSLFAHNFFTLSRWLFPWGQRLCSVGLAPFSLEFMSLTCPTVGWVSKTQYGGIKDIVLWNQLSGRAFLWAFTSSLLNAVLFTLPPKILRNGRLHVEKTKGIVRVRLWSQPTTEPLPVISWPRTKLLNISSSVFSPAWWE